MRRTLLNFRVTPDKVIETLSLRLGPVHREGEVVVLEVESHTGKVDDGLDTSGAELLGVTDTRALEDQGRGEGSARDDDLLAGTEGSGLELAWVQGLGGNGLDADGPAVLDDNLVNLGVAGQVQVAVDGAGGVDVGVSAVRSTATGAVLVGVALHVSTVTYVSLLIHLSQCSAPWPVVRSWRSSTVGIPWDSAARRKSSLIGYLAIVQLPGILQAKGANSRVVSERNLDGTLSSVNLTVLRSSLVGLMLPHERKEFLSGPALGLEVIICRRVSHRARELHARTLNLQSDALARVYIMKLIDEPPPRM